MLNGIAYCFLLIVLTVIRVINNLNFSIAFLSEISKRVVYIDYGDMIRFSHLCDYLFHD